MTIMGIDPSMNSTGICIDEDGKRTYYLLSTKATKKAIKAANEIDQLCILQIPKEESLKEEKSIHKSILQQINLTKNISYITDAILHIIRRYKPDYVVIESPAFRAIGRVSDLSGLNHAIRLECLREEIPCYPVPPTTVKAQTTGRGWASKDEMILTWKSIESSAADWEEKGIKVSDLADAWALCSFDIKSAGINPREQT